MGAHGVGEGRVDRGGAQIRGHDGGLIDAAEAADIGRRHLAWPHASAGDHGAERVEDAVLAGQHDIRRKRPVACLDHVAGEPSVISAPAGAARAGTARWRGGRPPPAESFSGSFRVPRCPGPCRAAPEPCRGQRGPHASVRARWGVRRDRCRPGRNGARVPGARVTVQIRAGGLREKKGRAEGDAVGAKRAQAPIAVPSGRLAARMPTVAGTTEPNPRRHRGKSPGRSPGSTWGTAPRRSAACGGQGALERAQEEAQHDRGAEADRREQEDRDVARLQDEERHEGGTAADPVRQPAVEQRATREPRMFIAR